MILFPQEGNTIQLKHGHHTLPRIHEKTSFVYDGKTYCWEGHSELYEENSDRTILIASFETSWSTTNNTQLGRLEISRDGKSIMEMAVITAMIVQERSDEEKQAVSLNKGKYADYIRNNWQVRGKTVIHPKGTRGAIPQCIVLYRIKRRSCTQL